MAEDVVNDNQIQFLVHCFNDLQHAEALLTPEVVRYSIGLIVERGRAGHERVKCGT